MVVVGVGYDARDSGRAELCLCREFSWVELGFGKLTAHGGSGNAATDNGGDGSPTGNGHCGALESEHFGGGGVQLSGDGSSGG